MVSVGKNGFPVNEPSPQIPNVRKGGKVSFPAFEDTLFSWVPDRRSAEQLGDGNLLIDALDGLGKHGGHGEVLDLLALGGIDGGDRVQQGQLLDDAVVDAVDGGAGEDAQAWTLLAPPTSTRA